MKTIRLSKPGCWQVLSSAIEQVATEKTSRQAAPVHDEQRIRFLPCSQDPANVDCHDCGILPCAVCPRCLSTSPVGGEFAVTPPLAAGSGRVLDSHHLSPTTEVPKDSGRLAIGTRLGKTMSAKNLIATGASAEAPVVDFVLLRESILATHLSAARGSVTINSLPAPSLRYREVMPRLQLR